MRETLRGSTSSRPRSRTLVLGILVAVSASFAATPKLAAAEPDATEIVRAALELWRSAGSWASSEMVVHRPTFERSMALESWTRGQKDTLTRFTKPPKDAGNAVLKLEDDMWMFTPKLNQVMKLPSSMMGQSWMGSEFSYDDLAKTDRMLIDYDLEVIGTETHDDQEVHVILALPKDDAPVVWGKQVLKVRADSIVLEQTYFDQDMEALRVMTAERIERLDDRIYPVVMRMTSLDKAEHWTEIRTSEARFEIELSNAMFSRSSLQNPRPWKAPK